MPLLTKTVSKTVVTVVEIVIAGQINVTPPANTIQLIPHVDGEEVDRLRIVLLTFPNEDAIKNNPTELSVFLH